MSNHDYTKFAKKQTETVVDENQNGVPFAEEIVEPVIDTTKIGVVVDCRKLNVRKAPNRESDVVCVIDASTEITVDESESTEDFYKICTAVGVEGFCMKQYIEII